MGWVTALLFATGFFVLGGTTIGLIFAQTVLVANKRCMEAQAELAENQERESIGRLEYVR